MLLNSLPFAAFFAVFYVLYVTLKGRAQTLVLLLASYVFYGLWDYRFLLLLLATTLTDFVCGWGLGRDHRIWVRRALLLLSLGVNLGVLFFFKYFHFFADNAVQLLHAIGFSPDPITLKILLPVGISFYTFRSLTYTVDIYRRQANPTRNLLDYAVFVSFFPQLIAGPIERARTFLPQISAERRITYPMVGEGAWLILFGLFKKVVVADNMAVMADAFFKQPGDYPGLGAWLGIYAYTLQIYGDFSGYTDLARGTSRLLGFEPAPNFRMPYFATNPPDFWRRWHISLSTWLRDYLYISMGGNRGGTLRTYRNLFMTMLLGGLWHGAAWNFVLWGAYHGMALVLHRLLLLIWPVQPRDGTRGRVTALVKILAMLHIAAFGWILFRIESLSKLPDILHAMTQFALSSPEWAVVIAVYAAPLLLVDFLQERSGNMGVVKTYPPAVRLLVYGVLLFYVLACGRVEGFQFIYAQF